eukprot:s5559_g6.t1
MTAGDEAVLRVAQGILEESLGSNSQASARSRDAEAFTAEVVDRTLRGILSRAARLARQRGRPKLEAKEDLVQMELMCQAVCRMSSAKEVAHTEATCGPCRLDWH